MQQAPHLLTMTTEVLCRGFEHTGGIAEIREGLSKAKRKYPSANIHGLAKEVGKRGTFEYIENRVKQAENPAAA